MKQKIVGVMFAVILVLFIFHATAAALSIVKPATDSLGTITLYTTQPTEPFKLDAGVYCNIAGDPITDVVDHWGTLDLVASFGLHESISIGADIPFGMIDYAEMDNVSELDDESGLEDILINSKIKLVSSPVVNIGVLPYIVLPTGDEDKGLGSEDTNYGFRILFDRALPLSDYIGHTNLPDPIRHLEYMNIIVNIGYHINKDLDEDPIDYITGGAGVHIPLSEDLDVMAEVIGQTNARHPIQKKYEEDTIIEALGSIRYYTQWGIALSFAGGMGVNDSPGSPGWHILFGVTPARRVKEVVTTIEGIVPMEEAVPAPEEEPPPLESADRDNDGIPDIYDYCPDEPEDYDGVEDFDGCPE